MSKSLGNIFDPWEALDRQGADALRWCMITNGSPWESRRIGHEVLDEIVRQFLLTLWNVYGFFVTYANASGLIPSGRHRRRRAPLMDRWVLSQLADTVRDGARRARGLRRDRRGTRGSRRSSTTSRAGTSGGHVDASGTPAGSGGADADAAFAHAAPLPGDGRAPAGAVHPVRRRGALAEPGGGPGRRARLGPPLRLPRGPRGRRRSRARRGDGGRPRGRRARPAGPRRDEDEGPPAAVGGRRPLRGAAAGLEASCRRRRRAERPRRPHRRADARSAVAGATRLQGPRPALGTRVQAVAAALAATTAPSRDGSPRASTSTVDARRRPAVRLNPTTSTSPRRSLEGWGVASRRRRHGRARAELTPELRREGVARDLVRAIQDARKAAGLEVSDRIELGVAAGRRGRALDAHRD